MASILLRYIAEVSVLDGAIYIYINTVYLLRWNVLPRDEKAK